MIINASAKAIALLFTLSGIATTSTAERNLRRQSQLKPKARTAPKSSNTDTLRRTSTLFNHDDPRTSATKLAEPSITMAVEETIVTINEPKMALSKPTYVESESITVTFSVGSPAHPYWTSSAAPSLNLDYNYQQWSVGLFMRDADPQGGTLSPIVSIDICSVTDCDANGRNYAKYNDLSVTFSNEHLDMMNGVWPLQIGSYGTGFDAYVLEKGAAAIGPLEFSIRDEEDTDGEVSTVNLASKYKYDESTTVNKKSSTIVSGVLSKKQQIKNALKNKAVEANNKIEYGNGLEMLSSSIPESTNVDWSDVSDEAWNDSGEEDEEKEVATSVTSLVKNSLTSNKEKYEENEAVTINFALNSNADLSKYKIGFFMRMAHPVGLEPIMSLPLLDHEHSTTSSSNGVTSGSVTFDSSAGSCWPIDLYEWGTGFDAYILDDNGKDVVGPVKFSIIMEE